MIVSRLSAGCTPFYQAGRRDVTPVHLVRDDEDTRARFGAVHSPSGASVAATMSWMRDNPPADMPMR